MVTVQDEINDLLNPGVDQLGNPTLGQGTGVNIPGITDNSPINIAQSLPAVAGFGTPNASDLSGGTNTVNQLPSGDNAVTKTGPNLLNVALLVAGAIGLVMLYKQYKKVI